MNLKPKSPKKVNGRVNAIIKELGLNPKKATFLNFTYKDESYRATYCFNNCENESNKTDCEVVYGWMIWEDTKKSFIEAEFHSVIRQNGQLIDISPRQSGEKKILFIEDSTRPTGRKRPEAWHSRTNLKMINGFVAEEPKEVEIIELDEDYSELRYL